MTLQETYLEIWICLLCITGGVLIFAVTMSGTFPLHTPFDQSININTSPTLKQLNNTANNLFSPSNPSGTLVGNTTQFVHNSTNGNILSPITDSFFFGLNIIWNWLTFFFSVATGSFPLQVLALFGFPLIFIQVIQWILGIFLARFIIYHAIGR